MGGSALDGHSRVRVTTQCWMRDHVQTLAESREGLCGPLKTESDRPVVGSAWWGPYRLERSGDGEHGAVSCPRHWDVNDGIALYTLSTVSLSPASMVAQVALAILASSSVPLLS